MSNKVLEILTDRVLGMLDSGVIPWQRPWKNGYRPSNISGRAYNGINYFLLSMLGYETPVFLTFKQIVAMKGRIKAGEEKKHAPVYFWKITEYTKDRNGVALDTPKKVPTALYTQVWNISQVEGVELPKRFQSDSTPFNSIEAAEAIVNGYANAPTIKHGGNKACYNPNLDVINMPAKEQFTAPENYYSVLFHEMTYSTGHKSRLDRKEGMENISFASHNYSFEELIAEMGAALCCAHTGIDNTMENSAAYIAGWVKSLKDHPNMLMMAASRAQKAFNHIVPEEESEVEE